MQANLSVKSLIEDSWKANFRNVYTNITSKRLSLDSNSAVKIIVAVCNACHSNFATPSNINEKDLADLVKCLLKFIHVPSNEQYDAYAQSAFYILKLLIEKKSFDFIIELRDLIIPEFMPLILSEKHHTIYQSICKTIYNVIVRMAQGSYDSHKSKALKLTLLLAAIQKKLNKENSFLESVHNCLIALITLNISAEELTQYYLNVIKSFNRCESSLYPLVINNLSIIYTHLLKNEKYKLASNCYGATRGLLQTLTGKEFPLLIDIMDVLEWVNPESVKSMKTRTPERAHASLRTYHKNYNSTAALQAVCDFVSSTAFTALQLYKKNNTWIENVGVHSDYYKFLNDVSLIMAKTPSTCHCKKCPTTTNINEALRTLNTIGGLGRLCIINNNDLSRTYKVDIFRYLEKHVEYVTTLRTNNCEKWEKYWYDVGVHLYSIGIHLYQKKDTEMLILYLEKFMQALFAFEGFSSRIVDRTYLISALNCIGDSYLESKDFEKSLLFTALCIICADCPKNEINRWIKTKAQSREDTIEENRELQELTLVSVCRKHKTALSTYFPNMGLSLNTKRQTELLVYELRQYNSKWKSKIPMSAVFAELSKIASVQLAAEVFIEIWGDGDLIVHDSIPKLLRNTIKRVESEQVAKKDLLLAHLYFLQHKYQVKDTIVKNCDEMERTMNFTKASEATIVPPDPDEECDLVSSYECLKLSRYTKMMKELNKSLELSQEWVKKNIDDYDKSRFYKLLANIGHEYYLHVHAVKSLQAWELALKVADNSLHKLEATGFILELSDMRKPLVKKLITEAEKGVSTLIANKNYEELIIYYLSKAEGYLFVDFDTAYSSFQKAVQYHQIHQGSTLMQARIHLVHHKFLTLPCEFNVPDHQDFSLVKIHQANNSVNTYYNEASTISSYDMRIFFEIYENIAKMYHDLRLPREVRCYAKDSVVIAQKMVLPLRTSALLYYLAHADITTCRLSDCRAKLKDFSDILCLSKGKSMVPPVLPTRKKSEVEALVEEFKEIVLDAPKRVRSTSAGSPSFDVETFKLPSFVTHEEECECFYCTCFEYQQFVLKQTLLQALLYQHEKNLIISRDFFAGFIKINDWVRNRDDAYTKKIAKRISVDLVPVVWDKFAEIHCFMLLEYSYFLIRLGKISEGERVNKKLLGKIEQYSVQFVHLYNEVLLQRLNILSREIKVERPQPARKSVEAEEPCTNTPPSQRSQVVLPLEPQPSGSVESKKILPKSLKFDLSDDDDATEYKKVTLPKTISGARTPAPSTSQIKIYTNKATKKSKPVLAEIPVFKEPETRSAQSSTPVVMKDALDLAIRTKLLTERLRSSSRKGSSSSSAKTSDENASGGTIKVRQNLLSQLDSADESSVRRSARNKK